jgi:hypothetical protein
MCEFVKHSGALGTKPTETKFYNSLTGLITILTIIRVRVVGFVLGQE